MRQSATTGHTPQGAVMRPAGPVNADIALYNLSPPGFTSRSTFPSKTRVSRMVWISSSDRET